MITMCSSIVVDLCFRTDKYLIIVRNMDDLNADTDTATNTTNVDNCISVSLACNALLVFAGLIDC